PARPVPRRAGVEKTDCVAGRLGYIPPSERLRPLWAVGSGPAHSWEGVPVLFCSEKFLIFFIVVFLVYWAMPWRQARVWWLLAASFYFYASWNRWLALIICVSTLMDYLIGLGFEASSRPRLRRLLLGFSISANLGLLVYFKYANFFLQSLGDALH